MNEEAKTEEEKPKRAWDQVLADAAGDVRKFGELIGEISKAVRETAPKVITDLGEVVKVGYEQVATCDRVRQDRVAGFVSDLKDAGLEQEEAIGRIVIEFIRRDAEREKLYMEGASRMVGGLLEAAISKIPNMFAEVFADRFLSSDKMESIVREAIAGSICEEPMPPGGMYPDTED